jgi:hypothetical protein
MGTLHIEGLVLIASTLSRDVTKRLKYNDSSQGLTMVEHSARSLIYVAVLVRNQEVGDSPIHSPEQYRKMPGAAN